VDEPIRLLSSLLRAHAARLRAACVARRLWGADAGVSTLEVVIIALGLMTVAGLLVAAITAAVTRRANQLQ
jgi:hypothetical protein